MNFETAQQKTNTKGADGDVDALFLNALGCRWLVIDEASTASLVVLGLLDSYLRRACARHPYARQGAKQRPFGGLNIVFSGDLWQLPLVKDKPIFANPFGLGLSSEEQKIAKMFWMVSDPIHRLFLLTENHRAKDEWLKVVLESDRYGRESWAIDCFAHGLPTRNPGSWLPHQDAPTCGNQQCATLAELLAAALGWEQEAHLGNASA